MKKLTRQLNKVFGKGLTEDSMEKFIKKKMKEAFRAGIAFQEFTNDYPSFGSDFPNFQQWFKENYE